MENSIYTGGNDQEIIQLFTQTFTDAEGAEEGNTIGTFVRQLLQTPSEYLKVFITREGENIVGGVFFSRIRFEKSDINAWILSPAAVSTKVQGQGVGQRVIQYAHEVLKQEGVQVVITYGDINFYSKVGYQHITEEVIPAPLKLSYPEGWIAQSLEGDTITSIQGKSYCVAALNNPELW
ncbi:N-acetyltransferase [Algivirga pacifica]|uniref:N-acetyltransferase n=1 Tax=Algivirga pacifica TaxID=1162670 RepID=A0ABP9DHP7_9BACT